MSQSFAPFYDVNRTYEDNYLQGPFGAFAEVMKGDSAAGASAQSAQTTQSQSSDQAEEFLGFRVNLPFGIPAGPLLNERFTTAAFRMGFDLAVYKTVRSRAWGCNAFPNVLAVHPKNADGSLVPGSAELDEGVLADTRYELPISISNSFGVPSRDPDEWQPDMKKAIAAAGDGQLLVPSFQGSRVDGMDRKAYIADHVTTAHLVTETGAGLMEMNSPPMLLQALRNSWPLRGAMMKTWVPFRRMRRAINWSVKVLPAPLVPRRTILAFLYTRLLKISTMTKLLLCWLTPSRMPFSSLISNEVKG